MTILRVTSYTAFKKAEFTSKYLFKIIFLVLKAEFFSLTMGILYMKSQSGSCFQNTSAWENSFGFAGFQYCKGRIYIKIGLTN